MLNYLQESIFVYIRCIYFSAGFMKILLFIFSLYGKIMGKVQEFQSLLVLVCHVVVQMLIGTFNLNSFSYLSINLDFTQQFD